MIERHHTSEGHYATENGERLTNNVATDEELTELLKLIAVSRLGQYIDAVYGRMLGKNWDRMEMED